MTELVKSAAHGLGFDLVGVCTASPPDSAEFFKIWCAEGFAGSMDYLPKSAALRTDPQSVLPGCRSAIVVGLNYNRLPQAEPKIARYALGRDYHRVMRSKLKRLARCVAEQFPHSRNRACVDTAPLFERELAVRAGLGWLGKNSCLINTHRGSWFFLGVLLTTADLDFDPPAVGGCGNCTACIDACPTGAIVQLAGRWTVDSRKCISYQTIENRAEELAADTHGWVFGCDVCQDVCPFNHSRPHQPLRAMLTSEPEFLQSRPWPNSAELQTLTDQEWDELTRGSATRRATAAMWRRNARNVR